MRLHLWASAGGLTILKACWKLGLCQGSCQGSCCLFHGFIRNVSFEFVSGHEPALTTKLVWCLPGFPHAHGVVSVTVGCSVCGHVCAEWQVPCTYGWGWLHGARVGELAGV